MQHPTEKPALFKTPIFLRAPKGRAGALSDSSTLATAASEILCANKKFDEREAGNEQSAEEA